MRPVHILLIHQAFVSGTEAGGTRHFELLRFLARRGVKATVVTSTASYLTGGSVDTGRDGASREDVEGIEVLRVPNVSSLHRSFVSRVFAFLGFMCMSVVVSARARHVSLVIGTSPPIFQAVSAWLAAKLRGRLFVLEVRDLWPAFAIELGVLKNPFLIRLSHRLEHFLYGRAAHIIVNSPAYRDYLVQQGVVPEKISVIVNGVDTQMFEADDDRTAIRHELGLGKKFVVTYTGALGLANDIDTILRAAALLRHRADVHFLLVGDGKERTKLEALARSLDLRNVTFAGARSKRAIPGILSASDACVATLRSIPMFKTTYPNKVFDYMAAGKPTILAIDGLIREMMDRAGGGLSVPPGDPTRLAEAVSTLADVPDKAHGMGAAARRYVKEHFERTQQATQLGALVDQLLRDESRGCGARRFYRRFGKRWLDLALGLPMLAVALPVLAAVALVVRVSFGRPVLFRQRRPGLNGRPFTILKYRTMTDGRDAGGRPLPDSIRLTRIGRWLRANSLDELPELVNVVRGDMSLVGPRPLLMQYLDRYTPEQMRRHDVRPGITGWAQVRGRNGVSWEEKFAMDVWYVDNVSLKTDLLILVRTIWKTLRREGINQKGQATVQEFTGSR